MLKVKFFIFPITFIFTLILFCHLLTLQADGKQEYRFCLKNSYDVYKENFLSKDGRVIDYDRNSVTTSEGQSYILLQSLIMKDKKTFDLAWKWTKNNLQREDKLFSWLWGKNKDGKYGVLDLNSASDADVDIAFALFSAYKQWEQLDYFEEAIPIVNSIWNKETKLIDDNLTLMPGAIQAKDEKVEVNPSYFSPYAFKVFQEYDEIHDWSLLVDSSYYYLKKVMSKTRTHLPPNWFLIKNNRIVFEKSERSDFSYDALRVFARTYLDYKETGDKRALAILQKTKFFAKKWQRNKTFYVNYRKNGRLRDEVKLAGAAAILVPAISVYSEEIAEQIYAAEVEPYLSDEEFWDSKADYYSKNLFWFANYLYSDKLRGCGDHVSK